jgi:hypothetical protein
MSTDSNPVDPLFPRLLPLAVGALIAALAIATTMLPPAPSQTLAATSAGFPAPMTGDDPSLPDAASALRALGNDPAGEPPPTF